MNEQLQEKMLKLFNTAYYLAVNERPMSDFASLCTLQIKNSVDLCDFYLNDIQCKDFLESISAEQHLTVKETLNSKRPRFLSMMADGGTDVSTKELELIYVRYLDHGSVVNKFLKVHELKDPSAAGIISTIGEAIEQAGVNDWKQALVHMGTDGASVYTGRHNGIVTKLTQEIPWLTGIHCVAHNLELAALDALKTESALGEVKEMLQGIYKHYKYFPKALPKVIINNNKCNFYSALTINTRWRCLQ